MISLAIDLVYSLENEKRGVYAVGYFALSGSIDTGIAIRTMLFKDGSVHLQAGAGIVYDSGAEAEYRETVVKLQSNVRAIELAELYYFNQQQESIDT